MSNLRELQAQDLLKYSWPFTVYAIVNALLIFWYDVSSPAGISKLAQQNARHNFTTIIELLKTMGSTWWAAAAKHKLSEALLRIADRILARRQDSSTDLGQEPSNVQNGLTHSHSQNQSISDILPTPITLNTFGDLDAFDDAAFWDSIGLDFEADVASNVFSIF
jgi:hypothetical protein